jgi:hypothetical protein
MQYYVSHNIYEVSSETSILRPLRRHLPLGACHQRLLYLHPIVGTDIETLTTLDFTTESSIDIAEPVHLIKFLSHSNN